MINNYKIKFIPNEEIETIIPYLRMLDDSIGVDVLKERLPKMIEHNYKCAGVYDGDKLIGICGVWVLFKYYIGKHLEADNVMIHPDYRGKGIGPFMLDWVNDYGKSIGCVATELNSYIPNDRGNKFWKNYGCQKLGYHYRKSY